MSRFIMGFDEDFDLDETFFTKSNLPKVKNFHINAELFFNPRVNNNFNHDNSSYPVNFSLSMSNVVDSKGSPLFVSGKTAFFRVIPRNTIYQEKVGAYIFCPHCKEEKEGFVTLKTKEDEKIYYDPPEFSQPPVFSHESKYQIEGITCSCCKLFIEHDYLIMFSQRHDRTGSYSLYEDVYDNGDIVTVRLTTGFAKVTENSKIKLTNIVKRFSFNVMTGQSYRIYVKIDGKKIKGDGIRNISLWGVSNEDIRKETFLKVFALLYMKKMKIFGYPPLNLNSFLSKEEDSFYHSISVLSSFNRLPNASRSLFAHFLSLKPSLKKVKHISPDPLGDMCKTFNYTPSKSVRKYLTDFPSKIGVASEICRRNFSTEFTLFLIREMPNYVQELGFELVDALISTFGEKITYKKLHTKEMLYYLLRDSNSMYLDIKAATQEEPDLRGNIREIHDRFIKITKNLKIRGYAFYYTEKEKEKMNATYHEFDFILAEHSTELITIGNILSICVGSYSSRVLNKRLHIVYIKENGKIVACMEMSKDFKSLMQCKICYNRLPEGKLLLAILQWANDRNIKIKTTDITLTLDALQRSMYNQKEEAYA